MVSKKTDNFEIIFILIVIKKYRNPYHGLFKKLAIKDLR